MIETIKWLLKAQFIRYTLVGLVSLIVHYTAFLMASFFLFQAFGPEDKIIQLLNVTVDSIDTDKRSLNYFIDYFLIGFTIATVVNYYLSVKFVFEGGKYKKQTEILLFIATNAMVQGLVSLLAYVSIKLFGDHAPSSTVSVLSIVFSVMINFVVRKKVIFKS